MSVEILANTVGTLGVGCVVLAYFLVSSERVKPQDARYHLLNLCGAVMILCSLLVHWNLPSFIIECIWITISLYGLWRVWRARKS